LRKKLSLGSRFTVRQNPAESVQSPNNKLHAEREKYMAKEVHQLGAINANWSKAVMNKSQSGDRIASQN